jgi:hypothetical protein
VPITHTPSGEMNEWPTEIGCSLVSGRHFAVLYGRRTKCASEMQSAYWAVEGVCGE